MHERVLTKFPSVVREPSLFIARGAPASGKSTAAQKFRDEDRLNRKIVEKDKIRNMLSGGFVKEDEHLIHQTSVMLVDRYLSEGKTVVVSDTNLPNRSVKAFAEVAQRQGKHWYVVDFTDVPLDELHRRNDNRLDPWNVLEDGVPREVIDDMHRRFIKGRGYPLPLPEIGETKNTWERYENPKDLPAAVIVDIDGTLAKMNGRSPYDWSRVFEDRVNESVADHVRKLEQDLDGPWIVLMSGRDEVCREETEHWLLFHEIPFDFLHMRSEGDKRKDDLVKYELFNDKVRHNYHVQYVLDDRDQVVRMWRAIGLDCWQVAPGDF